ncbi:DUF4382 domain-containing protein [Alteromonas antoniana]|uniref:DUF4382 domain-containing protein n=1 Tax=Alteromonas antoniana TaxID=2803813 RepID=UPI001C47EDAA|nr:DUF4382 domain-containing protein [Alteromonas antoniana]
MNIKSSQKFKIASSTTLILAALATLTACGGSSGGDDDITPEPTTSQFSLAVSDAPVDNASQVVVYFDEVELTGNGEPVTINVEDDDGNPKMIDLLQLQGEAFEPIVDDTEIDAGEYSQLRLVVTEDSYIVMDDGTFPLRVPSNELKLDGFTALPGFEAAYTVEFDLRKSLVDPQGQEAIFLKPRGVRLVENDTVGTLSGTVSEALVLAPECAAKADPFAGNAVYVYEGNDLDTTMLGDDADASENDDEVRPFTIAPVTYNATSEEYEFVAGFVPAGDYTVSFSCLASFDEPETDEDEEDGFMLMTADETTVTAKETTTLTIE